MSAQGLLSLLKFFPLLRVVVFDKRIGLGKRQDGRHVRGLVEYFRLQKASSRKGSDVSG